VIDTATYILPMPPSANSLYPGRQRRHKSAAYKAWLKEAGLEVLAQGRKRISGKVEVVYELGRPAGRRRQDAFNREKAPSDLLVNLGVIEDDSLIERGTVCWSDEVPAGRVRVKIRAVDTRC
jgi:Holliday junction resolvase RusA-like endonuclease